MFRINDYVYPKVLPWEQIFNDLMDKGGLSYSQIAEILGKKTSSIDRWWKGGTEPKHSIGVSILTIHSRYCGQELTQARLSQAHYLEIPQMR